MSDRLVLAVASAVLGIAYFVAAQCAPRCGDAKEAMHVQSSVWLAASVVISAS